MQYVLARWMTHKDARTFLDTANLILHAKPRCGIFENVQGISHSGYQQEKAPLTVFREALEKGGYATLAVPLNLSLFHDVVRQRKKHEHMAERRRC